MIRSSARAVARLGLLGATLGALVPAWALAEEPPLRHAVVVGANFGGGTLDPLRYAERDAEAFAQVLIDLGGFAPDHVTVLYQPDPSTLRSALAHHAALSADQEQDLFLFYYSGHADGHGLRLDADTYFFDALKHDIRLIDSTARVGILDACRSGAITRLKGARVAASLFAGNEQIAASGEVWMTATSADELAQESEALRGGYFSHYLLSGMRGAAAGNDGLVEVQELYAYTRERVVRRSAEAGGVQRPTFDFNLAGQRDIALTDVRRASASLRLTPDKPGHASILRLADRVQLAEVDIPEDRPMQIALPPGRYLVRLRRDEGLFEGTVTLLGGMVAHVPVYKPVTLETSAFRGGSSPVARSFQDRMVAFQDASADLFVGVPLDQNPLLAGSLSGVIPGAGQVYNHQPIEGAAYFLGTVGVLATASFLPANGQDRPPVRSAVLGLGVGLWGASVADAASGVHRRDKQRPRTGPAIGASMGLTPTHRGHLGIMVEHTPMEHLTIGLDRTGVAFVPGQSWDVHVGSRVIGALEGERVRPGVFAAFGGRLGQDRLGGPVKARAVFGAGGLLRYHVLPRYFVEVDLRWERDGGEDAAVLGLGLGVPLGKAPTRRGER